MQVYLAFYQTQDTIELLRSGEIHSRNESDFDLTVRDQPFAASTIGSLEWLAKVQATVVSELVFDAEADRSDAADADDEAGVAFAQQKTQDASSAGWSQVDTNDPNSWLYTLRDSGDEQLATLVISKLSTDE